MKRDIQSESNVEKNEKEVNYIKKFKKRMNILKLVIALILIIFIGGIIRETFIMCSLANKSRKINTDNYYIKIYSYYQDSMFITESYNKDKSYLTVIKKYSPDFERKFTYYKKENEQVNLFEQNDIKIQSADIIGGEINISAATTNDIFSNIQTAMISSIDKATANGKECYVLKIKNQERFIDKETGLLVRVIDNDTITDYYYEFNVVKNQNIQKPDVTGYVLQ